MNTTFATWTGRLLAAAVIATGLAAVAVSAGVDPAPIVELVNRLAN